MKRIVLSGLTVLLCIISIAQRPELFNYQGIPHNLSGVKFPSQTIIGRLRIPSYSLTDSLVLSNSPGSLFRITLAPGTLNWNTDRTNIFFKGSNKTNIYHSFGNVPDLTKIMDNPRFERVSMRGFYIILTGKPDLVNGIYFDLRNKLIDNSVGVVRDQNGDIYTLVPGWKSGQYLPLLNSGGNGRLEWRYYGTFPSRLYHTIKTGK